MCVYVRSGSLGYNVTAMVCVSVIVVVLQRSVLVIVDGTVFVVVLFALMPEQTVLVVAGRGWTVVVFVTVDVAVSVSVLITVKFCTTVEVV